MRQRLKAWVSATRLRRQGKENSNSDPAMPCLPTPRPSALTPTPSTQDLISLSQIAPIFSKLPTEIRRQILVIAFGNRTLHMDLALLPTLEPADFEGFKGCCDLHATYKSQSYGSKDRSLNWQWRGYQCNRRLPAEYYTLVQFDEYEIAPADDECSRRTHCSQNKRYSCWIGVIGWFLACRQAYTEGLEVLYSTNTFHLCSKPLITNLNNLLLPQRMSMITSLEVVWLVDTYLRAGKSIPRQDNLDEILSILDSNFPQLRRLNLSIQLKLYDQIPVHLNDLIETLDAFVVRRAQYLVEPITFGIASWAYELLFREVFNMHEKKKHLDNKHMQDKVKYKMWRYLDGNYDFASNVKTKEIYGTVEDATAQNGYWMRLGDDSARSMIIIAMGCFGGGGGIMRDGRFSRPKEVPTWDEQRGTVVMVERD
ncbi:uncharacterized protein B0J16DRAFT_348041 [Fusarium flagelliforme]|uniref:uncharacterized protein n=1 Tax=Fusarium flagelliforme TaxID=2675880 RepID=UPI001E8DDC34|nr:uncharacterized protein B0J16DRAFT_348041 [Fusarium flagelliforme]KAH7180006.1 hypothetical protein B0J16DRAFT_348041 [Fusarium flagelliforme]